MENKRAHLQMIQAVVNRMSGNSFLLKGWSVVLVSALFALSAASSQKLSIYLSFFPAIVFWMLDGYFLWQEKLFRKLYDRVRHLEKSQIDFAMDTAVIQGEVDKWSRVVFSKTLIIFHGTVVGLIAFAMLVLIFFY